jgi:hypothetical protein
MSPGAGDKDRSPDTGDAVTWTARGDRAIARATLRPILDFQTEGLDMPDLIEARSFVERSESSA